MWRMVNLCQRGVLLARLSTARRISCRNAAINIVVCRAILQHLQVASADGHQPFVSHFSLTRPLIKKTSMRWNLTTAIVFDELVVKGEQAHQRRCLPSHAVLCRRYCQIHMTPHQQLAALKLASFPLHVLTRIATNCLGQGRHDT